MPNNKIKVLLIIIINVIGTICLAYFAALYLIHDIRIAYTDSMLPAENWDRAGMILTFGFLPLLGANTLSALFIKVKQKFVKFLFFVPSVVCIITAINYLISSTVGN